MGTHGLVPREGPVSPFGSTDAIAVSPSPKLVDSHVSNIVDHVQHVSMMGKGPNRVQRGHLDPCKPWKLSAILDGMWPRASLDYTSPRNPLSPQNGLVPVFLHFVIT
ncbi:hypothetical protein CRG98_028572 [Punica granatum]|uniref:Uncharacterized protein n=1 Tax=Punica granatum TaxID=22663 RepID=A0A2I0J484_PUNGR|nr:hypothetical protein CRG98_028572 [Punica granatum]